MYTDKYSSIEAAITKEIKSRFTSYTSYSIFPPTLATLCRVFANECRRVCLFDTLYNQLIIINRLSDGEALQAAIRHANAFGGLLRLQVDYKYPIVGGEGEGGQR